MAKTEDIEAKLAAYIDGDLDAAGRAEIEKHLSNNTQHRRLIRELMQHRDLLQSLPREMAPAEVCESINAQLERAVLLGDVDSEGDASAMRIGGWHQFRAIAAVLVLTACLAAVIALLLPRPGSKPGEIADVRELPAPAGSARQAPEREPPTLQPAATDLALSASAQPTAMAENVPAPAAEVSSTTAPALAESNLTEQQRRAALALSDPLIRGFDDSNGIGGGAAALKPMDEVATNAALPGQQMFDSMVNNQMNLQAAPAGEPLVILVPSEEPDRTKQKVADYLSRNRIVWQAEPEPAPEALDIPRTQTAYGARLTQQQVQLKDSDANVAGENATAPSPPTALSMADAQGAANATGQNTESFTPQQQGAQFRIYDNQENGGQIAIDGVAKSLTAPPVEALPQQRFVVPRMTVQQLAELRAELGTNEESDDQAADHPISIASAAPVTLSANGMPIERALGMSGSNRMLDAAAPTTSPAAMSEFSKFAGPLAGNGAAGQSNPRQSRAAAAPTTLPSNLLTLVFPRFDEVQRSMQAAGRPFSDELRLDRKSQVTQSAVPATDAERELRDVVIVVQRQPSTQPATAPADAPPTAP
jgi:hypothetical protein